MSTPEPAPSSSYVSFAFASPPPSPSHSDEFSLALTELNHGHDETEIADPQPVEPPADDIPEASTSFLSGAVIEGPLRYFRSTVAGLFKEYWPNIPPNFSYDSTDEDSS